MGVCSEDEFEESSKWKRGKSPVIPLSELFVDDDLFVIPPSPIEEQEHCVMNDISEQDTTMVSVMEELADNYEYLMCESQLQTPTINASNAVMFCSMFKDIETR